MQTIAPTTHTWKRAAQVIIDWSRVNTPLSDIEAGLETDHLVRWIHSYPERAAVHVFLSRSRFGMRDRRIQNTLQSLGCTVTMRSPAAGRQHGKALEEQSFAADCSFW